MKIAEEIIKHYFKSYVPDFSQENQENIVEYLKDHYSLDQELNDFTISLINNHILVQSEIMRDIREINNRLKEIEQEKKLYKREDYEYRKLEYFKRLNLKAKEEIEEFFTEESIEYTRKQQVIPKKYWQRDTGDFMKKLIDVPPYDYSYNKRFYNHKFNFSVNTKYEFLKYHNPKRIEKKITLKEKNPEQYYNELTQDIIKNDLFNKVLFKIRSHHILIKREEIFNTLLDLYENEKYQSFINLAVIQVEGLFYDFSLIINNEKELENLGTLTVKVENVFSKHGHLWLSMYPYFAFEMPKVRNKIAHQGLWNSDDLKNFANELIFDLYAIGESIDLTNSIPFVLHKFFPYLKKEVSTTHNEKEYLKIVLIELFAASSYGLDEKWSQVFFDTIKNRNAYKDVLEFYRIKDHNDSSTNYYQECCEIHDVINSLNFWNEIINLMNELYPSKNSNDKKFLIFITTLSNTYINEFEKNSEIKNKIIKIKQTIVSLTI